MFTGSSTSTKSINVQIHGDTATSGTPTHEQDEVFFIELSSPSANATIEKGRATVTLVDDDQLRRPGVQFLSAVSGAVLSIGHEHAAVARSRPHRLRPTDVTVGWNMGAALHLPVSPTDTRAAAASSDIAPGAGAVQSWPHCPRRPTPGHCYSVFTHYCGGRPRPDRQDQGQAFNAAGRDRLDLRLGLGERRRRPPSAPTRSTRPTTTAWCTRCSAASRRRIVAPHLESGPVGRPTQNRSAVVPLIARAGGSSSALTAGGCTPWTRETGNLVWSRSAPFGDRAAEPRRRAGAAGRRVQGLGGNNDMLLVGTNNGGRNNFFALDPTPATTMRQLRAPADGERHRHGGRRLRGQSRVLPDHRVVRRRSMALDLGPLARPPSPGHARLEPKAWARARTARRCCATTGSIFGDSSARCFALHVGRHELRGRPPATGR